MEIRAMTQAEQKYTFKQSSQIEGQTAQIGYLRGDFGSGKDFFTTWFDTDERLNNEIFKAEINDVINTLRSEDCGLLAGREEMSRYVRQHPEGAYEEGRLLPTYGFRADTEQYAFLIRCCPSPGDYNFYCYCYEKKWLDRNIEKAAQGIRFKDANYREIFRIPDGGSIVITTAWGEKNERTCRYIDEYHCEVGNNVYHVDEFAERMARNGATYEPKADTPPKNKQQAR